MEEQLMSLACSALSILVPAICAMIIELLRRKLGLEKIRQVQYELETKTKLAKCAVRFVEHYYREIHGQEKYDRVAEWLAERAKERGLAIPAEEMQGLIEAALRMIKDEFGEQWGKQVKVS